MQAFVFTDEALREQAGRFVWLEIDVEKAQNADFKRKFPVRALPTYFVIEPDTEQVAFQWVGGATVPQFQRILDDAHRFANTFHGERRSKRCPTRTSYRPCTVASVLFSSPPANGTHTVV